MKKLIIKLTSSLIVASSLIAVSNAAQAVSVNGSTFIVQSGKVGINTIPDSTLHIASSSVQIYNPADSRTWGLLLVSNNVNNLNKYWRFCL